MTCVSRHIFCTGSTYVVWTLCRPVPTRAWFPCAPTRKVNDLVAIECDDDVLFLLPSKFHNELCIITSPKNGGTHSNVCAAHLHLLGETRVALCFIQYALQTSLHVPHSQSHHSCPCSNQSDPMAPPTLHAPAACTAANTVHQENKGVLHT